MERLYKRGQVESPLCICCNMGVVEDERHLFLECPQHAPARLAEVPQETWEQLPDCLRLHGLMPIHPDEAPEDLAGAAGKIQYALLDVLKSGAACLPPDMQPQARWRTSQEPRNRADPIQGTAVAAGPVFRAGANLATANGEYLL